MEFSVYTISVMGVFRRRYEIFLDNVFMYEVESASFWNGSEMVFTDSNQDEVLTLKRTSTFSASKFIIYDHKKAISTVTKDTFGMTFHSDSIYGQHVMKGKSWNTDFTLFAGDEEIAKVSRKTFRSKDKGCDSNAAKWMME